MSVLSLSFSNQIDTVTAGWSSLQGLMGDVNNPSDCQITVVYSHRSTNNHVRGSAGCLGPGMCLLRHPGVYFRRKPAGAAFRADKLSVWTVGLSPHSQSENFFSYIVTQMQRVGFVVRLSCHIVATEPQSSCKSFFHATQKLQVQLCIIQTTFVITLPRLI